MSVVKIKIDGTELLFFNKFSFSGQINSIASSISFDTFNNYETFGYSSVEVEIDNVLVFTGEIVNKTNTDSIPTSPYTYKAESLTHELFESSLPVEAYPLQLENSTLQDLVEYICSFFDITAVFDQSASSEASSTYPLADLGLEKTAGELINDIVTNAGLILTHNSSGELVITKSIEQSEIVLPMYLTNGKSYDLKKFFHNYIALGQAPIGEDADIQAIAVFDNIKETRSTTKIQDSGGIDSIEFKAYGMRADSLKAIQQTLSFNNFFCSMGDFIVLDDLKLIVNKVDFSQDSTGEKCNISVIDALIYER
jgi:hypothetical protein